jgi:hypothetical protein
MKADGLKFELNGWLISLRTVSRTRTDSGLLVWLAHIEKCFLLIDCDVVCWMASVQTKCAIEEYCIYFALKLVKK